jgi:hypothetical protein
MGVLEDLAAVRANDKLTDAAKAGAVAQLKADAAAAAARGASWTDGDVEVAITSATVDPVRRVLVVDLRAWRGKDEITSRLSLPYEWRNPPPLADDPEGDILTSWTEEVADPDGTTREVTRERRLRLDPLAAVRRDIGEHIRRQAP